jgi:hypothetical protein
MLKNRFMKRKTQRHALANAISLTRLICFCELFVLEKNNPLYVKSIYLGISEA